MPEEEKAGGSGNAKGKCVTEEVEISEFGNRQLKREQAHG